MVSICIPRVFYTIKRDDIEKQFKVFGSVQRIDIVRANDNFNKVFIHFNQFNNTDEALKMKEKLLNNQEVKVVYSEPNYWKCSLSRVEKPTFYDNSAPKLKIDLGGERSLFRTSETTIP